MKNPPLEAARHFVEKHFPACRAALLAGSVVRGQETETSDLDIVVIDDRIAGSYRESFTEDGWMIEAFIHTSESYRRFFESDRKRGRPSLPRMCLEGIVLKDDGIAGRIRQEAEELLANGPDPWTAEEIRVSRYFITDLLTDFEGSRNPSEDLFIAGELARRLHEFILRTNGRWTGEGKWIVRALREFDEALSEEFCNAFDRFFQTRDKSAVIQLVDRILEPCGGRLFAGFSLGKPPQDRPEDAQR